MTMDNTLIDVSGRANEEWESLFAFDHELLVSTLNEASERTARRTKGNDSILASITQTIPWHDPLDAFSACLLLAASTAQESFFWERAAGSTALVGSGIATTIETRGETRFHEAATRWRTLLSDAVIATRSSASSIVGSGPTLLGGFAFDALAPRTDLWRGFPDGLLVLPALLLSYGPEGAALTVNVMMTANDGVAQRVQEVTDLVARLLLAIQRVASKHEEPSPVYLLRTHNLVPASEWKRRVADVAGEIREGRYEKVVLARSVRVTSAMGEGMSDDGNGGDDDNTNAKFDIRTVLRRLRQSYPGAYVFAFQRGTRFFAGATPERLVQAQDGKIETMALAGSAPRGATPQEDERIGAALLASEKNKREHAIVVEQIHDALAKHCRSVEIASRPRLLKLRNVQHLETPVTGMLRAQGSILDVIADLHPTPADGAFPPQLALETIRRVEQLDRGWYAGPLGWIGAGGHGEFAVALRSGLIDEHKATLFAGCGIVGDSDPQSEYEESSWKLQVMLRSLGDTWKGE